MRRFIIAALASTLLAAPAHAAIVGGAVTGGTAGGTFIQITPAPGFTVGNNNQQDPNLYAFNEVQNHTLTTAIGSIAAGTVVSSHYVFFDPAPSRSVIGGVTFDSAILAIITATGDLLASDPELGLSWVNYLNPAARGLEQGDTVSITGNTMSLRWTASTPGDYVRVITVGAVPEPQTWAMMLLGFFGLGTAIRSARRAQSRAPVPA